MGERIIVITTFEDYSVGFEDYFNRILSLSAVYKHITVICDNRNAFEEVKKICDKVILISLRFNNVLRYLEYVIRIKKILFKNTGDIFLLHTKLSFYSLFFPKQRCFSYWNIHPSQTFGKNKIKDFGDILKNIKNWIFTLLTYHGAKKSNRVMPIGEELQNDLCKHNITKNVKLVYLGVKDRFYLNIKDKQKKHIILIYIGSLARIRGIDLILGAFEKFLKSSPANMRLVLVGATKSSYKFYKKMIKEKGLEKNVIIIERLKGEKIPKLLENADIGISLLEPNIYYSFNPPTKIFEYMAAGLPVIANSIRTNTRYIKNGYNGYICEYTQESFEKKLGEIWRGKRQIKAMKNNARFEGEKYRWSVLEKEFISVFLETN